MASRKRADLLLVERGLFESRAKAQDAIAAGRVTADGKTVRKPADEIASTAALEASPAHPWVSRGGVKLAAALDHLSIPVSDCICLDIGASTGGFTDVLLERGARHVYAVDVGRGQLHEKLHGHPRVTSLEATDIRKFDAASMPERPSVIVIDVSFISLKHVLPVALALAAPTADIVALIKPQFEAPREAIKKGFVRDEAVHRAVCDDIANFATGLGLKVIGLLPSPITGGDGNREFLIGLKHD
jgi:23S rRNA (cytidine1920-2'-O)/16S rRNA (cytidine1409-2'-O)-methyltransferase